MKTTITLQPTLKAEIANVVSNWLRSKNLLFSSIMEEEVTNQSALLVTHAVLSLSLFLLFAPFSAMAAIALLCWFLMSIMLCKKGGLK